MISQKRALETMRLIAEEALRRGDGYAKALERIESILFMTPISAEDEEEGK